jgi:hypothetical protein
MAGAAAAVRSLSLSAPSAKKVFRQSIGKWQKNRNSVPLKQYQAA